MNIKEAKQEIKQAIEAAGTDDPTDPAGTKSGGAADGTNNAGSAAFGISVRSSRICRHCCDPCIIKIYPGAVMIIGCRIRLSGESVIFSVDLKAYDLHCISGEKIFSVKQSDCGKKQTDD